MNTNMTVVDLFAGPGGLGTGFSTYFHVTEAIDNNRDACDTYQHNHADTRVYCKDVRDVTFVSRDFDGIVGVIGGPECKDFSVLNTKRDPFGSRAQLMRTMLDAIVAVHPRFCLIENVATISPIWKRYAEKRLAREGYKVVSRVILAWNYGSVQVRRRWILTGCLDREIYPEPQGTRRVAREILTGEPSEIQPRPETIAAIQTIPAGKWVALPGQEFKVYYVVDPAKPLPAIVNPCKLRYVRPDRTGYLSMSELYRADDFPEGYKFFGTLSSRGKQLADAVPVRTAKAFAEAFHSHLK